MKSPEQTAIPAAGHSPLNTADSDRQAARLKWVLCLLPLGYLWFCLIDNLRLEWETNPQYSYGLVVPLLIAGLLVRRWQRTAGDRCALIPANPWPAILPGALLALFILPTRLIQAATPEWRPLQWTLGIETVGLTLCAIYLAGGKNWLRQLAFPVVFFLIAVPWPTPIEAPIIQGLSRVNAAMVVNVLGLINVPAIQHGNVIEVSTGVVGINDACSGIRSLQSSLMISLFLGEYYFLNWRRRCFLVPIGFLLAMLLNLCRASLLTWLAAKHGIGAIAQYHDEAGFTILLICTALLWSIGWLLNHWRDPKENTRPTDKVPAKEAAAIGKKNINWANRLGVALIVWLALVESGVALWYHIRESHLAPTVNWSVNFPESDPTYKNLPLTPEEHELLRFDQGQKGEWRESDGTDWQVFYFNWAPGRIAGYLAKRHTPDICMTATGYKMTFGPELMVLNVNNVQLPMRHYVFDGASGPLQVYQCHWEAGMGKDTFTADESARFNLIRGIWAGRGNQGQKVLEIVIAGSENAEQARQSLVSRLGGLIKIEN